MIIINKIYNLFFDTKHIWEKDMQYLHKLYLKDIGKTKALCPYCNNKLESFGQQVCKNCKNRVFIVYRGRDCKKVLVTLDEKGFLLDEFNYKIFIDWAYMNVFDFSLKPYFSALKELKKIIKNQ